MASKKQKNDNDKHSKKIFPSTRFLMAILLCACFISLSVSTSNISLSIVCMVKQPSNVTKNDLIREVSRIRRNLNDTETILFDEYFNLKVNNNGTDNEIVSFGNNTPEITSCFADKIKKRAYEIGELLEDKRKDLYDYSDKFDSDNQEVDISVEENIKIEPCSESNLLLWTSTDQGIVFAAQNAGSLLMLITGTQADRLNSKWCIVVALILLIISNIIIPLLAGTSFFLVVLARVFTGFSDSFLQPSANSMITRWFPPKERPFVIGLVTGGRQIGTLLILPVAGFLCSRKDILNGWPSIFYLSALIGAFVLVCWLILSADKPSKHFCISKFEQTFIEERLVEENMGKRKDRKKVPWKHILTSKPLWAGVAALICHEYPLVIMLQLLPKYINDILKFSTTANGIVSALPIAVLFISKTLASSLSSMISSRKKGRFLVSRTTLAKIFNFIASLGLGISIALVPLMSSFGNQTGTVVLLCSATFFAGMHSPGVILALVQIAPAYSAFVTGLAFGFVAIFGIINKVLSNYIVQNGSISEWTIVFEISAIVAILPIVFFTIWGSADRQPWASQKFAKTNTDSEITIVSTISTSSLKNNKINPKIVVKPPPIEIPKSISNIMLEENKKNETKNKSAILPPATPSSRLPSCNFDVYLGDTPQGTPRIIINDEQDNETFHKV
ncbi:Sialin [Strongyloides ratti]|uniref:Sialin n=1 Tax=Strongyloides ratti TaxID=34506 RepID=A0A090LGS9_STRRB|nr:Sialin [Strongyloides ratti]CEF68987.1 Sialin [Strongyloides ratti]